MQLKHDGGSSGKKPVWLLYVLAAAAVLLALAGLYKFVLADRLADWLLSGSPIII